ncbi:EF-P 5-aminopentanol modification-associated protein YfmH [Peptostreptococcus canis]|uniref:Insulinase family protein n=1 Tax=Peptostreptococcus canis TaxID=1159213 RepID=A0ABR6TKG7_9FIRM|nr:pitrilysin family protein [Peptostreptococcus canis]MBC2575900.1 insulinase family protein [Peptostreptococcus canis]MBP1997979.1 putative Zn-dependent peptidase [Peptostreptococcus canis]
MERIYNETINEELFIDTLDNGLEVYYMPKKGFINKYAILGVDFGSNDLEFISIDDNNRVRVNEGIAHFLEHKMFEQPDGGNAFDKFSVLGANANAFTSFNMTAYLFSATENFYESLKHLIEYVQTPYYTNENVEKEKGIIAQEIKMYEDDPEWNVFFNCLKAMYSNHHTNIDIAGSVESIYKITPEELYTCYNTFYNPSNMKLFVIGDLDENEIMKVVKDANNDSIAFKKDIERFMPEEPVEVNNTKIEEEFTVSMPLFYVGYKDSMQEINGKEILKREISTDILFDIIFSESAQLHEDLYNEGLIVGGLSGGYNYQKDYAYAVVSGVSKDPEEVKRRIDRYISELRINGINQEEFELNKRKKIGAFLKLFDSINYIANNFLRFIFKGVNILDYLDALKEIKIDDITSRLNNFFLEDYSVISIVRPKKD